MASVSAVSEGIHIFFKGLSDSLRGFYLIFHYDMESDASQQSHHKYELSTLARRRAAQKHEEHQSKSPQKLEDVRILNRILLCCILNGGIFGSSLLLFNCLLLPLLQGILLFVISEGDVIWENIEPVLVALFNMFWVLPLFLLSRMINTIWFQDIADSAFRQKQGRPQFFSSVSKYCADTTLSVIIQFLFLIQAHLMLCVPLLLISDIIYLVHMSMLNSLYSFEYRLCNVAWQLDKRLRFLEENWPYFLGFGLPLAVITRLPASVLVSGCLFAVLFPIFIISANEAALSLKSSMTLPLFAGVVWLSSRMVEFLISPGSVQPQMGPARLRRL